MPSPMPHCIWLGTISVKGKLETCMHFDRGEIKIYLNSAALCAKTSVYYEARRSGELQINFNHLL